MIKTTRRVLQENAEEAAGIGLAAANLIGTVPYLFHEEKSLAHVCMWFAATTIPVSYLAGRSVVTTYRQCRLDFENLPFNPKRFAFKSAKTGALSGIALVVLADLGFSAIAHDLNAERDVFARDMEACWSVSRLIAFPIAAGLAAGACAMAGAGIGTLTYVMRKRK